MEKICKKCNKSYQTKNKNQKYCSRSCLAVDLQYQKCFSWNKLNEKEKLDRLKKSFEKKVIKKDGCWDWQGPSQKNGYLRIRYDVKKIGAHCASWLIYKGDIPTGFQINHHCDNRRCTNPEHLYLGTRKQNDEDRVQRERQAKGEKNRASKLTEDDVLKIKQLIDFGMSDMAISIDFKVSPACIWFIRKNQRWKHV